MSNDLLPYVERALAGTPMYLLAKEAGVHNEVMRRAVLKHPDYDKAKAEGKLHSARSLPLPKPKYTDDDLKAAVDEALAGHETPPVIAKKYGIPYSTLSLALRKIKPSEKAVAKDLDPVVEARKQMRIAKAALAEAVKLMRMVPGQEAWELPLPVLLPYRMSPERLAAALAPRKMHTYHI